MINFILVIQNFIDLSQGNNSLTILKSFIVPNLNNLNETKNNKSEIVAFKEFNNQITLT